VKLDPEAEAERCLRDTNQVFIDLDRCRELSGVEKSVKLLALLNRTTARFGSDDPATAAVRRALEEHEVELARKRRRE